MLAIEPRAQAQMQLPGAVGGSAEGASSGGAPSAAAPPRPVAMKAPSEETIVGKTLVHDGAKGDMAFEKGKDGLALTRLKLDGESIDKPGAACTVEVALGGPLAAKAEGRPAGAVRFTVPVQACAFSIDVLDGAVLVTRPEPTCDFAAADCRVTPGGLWGPPPADISAKKAAELAHERVQLESTMRTNFRALLRKAGTDKVAVKAIARDQAAFSSEREMTCRDYAQETEHGFCSTQITEARALALMAQFGGAPAEPRKPRPARVKTSAPAPAPPADTLPPEQAKR